MWIELNRCESAATLRITNLASAGLAVYFASIMSREHGRDLRAPSPTTALLHYKQPVVASRLDVFVTRMAVSRQRDQPLPEFQPHFESFRSLPASHLLLLPELHLILLDLRQWNNLQDIDQSGFAILIGSKPYAPDVDLTVAKP
jgi:hypothetical protein